LPKFVKKPVEIEAQRVNLLGGLDSVQLLADWCDGEVKSDCIEIYTLEGTMKAMDGDWIIKEPFATEDRQFYPCKPSIFQATYEQIDW